MKRASRPGRAVEDTTCACGTRGSVQTRSHQAREACHVHQVLRRFRQRSRWNAAKSSWRGYADQPAIIGWGARPGPARAPCSCQRSRSPRCRRRRCTTRKTFSFAVGQVATVRRTQTHDMVSRGSARVHDGVVRLRAEWGCTFACSAPKSSFTRSGEVSTTLSTYSRSRRSSGGRGIPQRTDTRPWLCITARGTKFSDAIISRVFCWRLRSSSIFLPREVEVGESRGSSARSTRSWECFYDLRWLVARGCGSVCG